MAQAKQGTPFVAGGPLATSLREWVRMIWPDISLRRRTVLEAALARLREGYELAVTPAGEPLTVDSSRAAGCAQQVCYHGANPHCVAQILKEGLLPNKGKRNIVGVWSSPHIHTAVKYPIALKGGHAVTTLGPAIRVILKLRVPSHGIIKRIKGRKNKSGNFVNYQWPLRPEAVTICSIHLWCWDGYAGETSAIQALNIAVEKKLRALLRQAETYCNLIPEDDRERQELDVETPTPAPTRMPPEPAKPKGSAGRMLTALRRRLKRQRRWDRQHRERIAAANLPQPPEAFKADDLGDLKSMLLRHTHRVVTPKSVRMREC